ncbi:MAG: Frizzy aggregation protein FrzB [Myxococcota bacterium]
MSDEAVDVVLFEIAGVRFGADLAQVRRVDLDEPTESVGYPLGRPRDGRRALVFQPEDGPECRLAIDAVLGVRKIPVTELRRLPRAVAAPPMSLGAWLDGDDAVLLVDLFAMNPFTRKSGAQEDHGH